MISMGLDTSTKTGMVVLESLPSGTPKVLHAIEIFVQKGITGLDRCSVIAENVVEMLDMHTPDRVVIENYGFANSHTLATLVEIGTVVRYFIKQKGYDFDLVAPPSLKKFIAGKGNVKKDEMRLETYKKYHYEHKSDNVIDAYGLAMIGIGLGGRMNVLTVPQKEVLKKISESN